MFEVRAHVHCVTKASVTPRPRALMTLQRWPFLGRLREGMWLPTSFHDISEDSYVTVGQHCQKTMTSPRWWLHMIALTRWYNELTDMATKLCKTAWVRYQHKLGLFLWTKHFAGTSESSQGTTAMIFKIDHGHFDHCIFTSTVFREPQTNWRGFWIQDTHALNGAWYQVPPNTSPKLLGDFAPESWGHVTRGNFFHPSHLSCSPTNSLVRIQYQTITSTSNISKIIQPSIIHKKKHIMEYGNLSIPVWHWLMQRSTMILHASVVHGQTCLRGDDARVLCWEPIQNDLDYLDSMKKVEGKTSKKIKKVSKEQIVLNKKKEGSQQLYIAYTGWFSS